MGLRNIFGAVIAAVGLSACATSEGMLQGPYGHLEYSEGILGKSATYTSGDKRVSCRIDNSHSWAQHPVVTIFRTDNLFGVSGEYPEGMDDIYQSTERPRCLGMHISIEPAQRPTNFDLTLR